MCQIFSIDYSKTPNNAVDLALKTMNFKGAKCSTEYVLKVCGQEEYLMGDEPLIQYKVISAKLFFSTRC